MWEYKQNELYHYGVKGMKWGKRTKNPADSMKYKIFPSRPTGFISKRVEKNLGSGKYVGSGKEVKVPNSFENTETVKKFARSGYVSTERRVPGYGMQRTSETPWANPFDRPPTDEEALNAWMNKSKLDVEKANEYLKKEYDKKQREKQHLENKKNNTQKRVEKALKKAKLKKISPKLVGKGRKKLSETGAKKMAK